MDTGMSCRGAPCEVLSLTIDPTTPTTVYAGTWNGGVFKTTDGGAHWTAMNTGLTSGDAECYVRALAVDPAQPATVYAGTVWGVFRTTDGGSHWTKVNTGLTCPSSDDLCEVTAFTMESAAKTLYAGLRYFGVFKTSLGGTTWTSLNAGLPDLHVSALALDRATSTVVAGTESGLVFLLDQDRLTVSPTPTQGRIVGPGISCGTGGIDDCREAFPADTTVTLTAVPALGYGVAAWTGCATVSADTRRCTVLLTHARTVGVTFEQPTVTVIATRPTASEAGLVAGKLTFMRTGPSVDPLTVAYTVGGTATAGSDYASLGTAITFPAGVTSVSRMVTPLQDTLQEAGEIIVVTLTPSSLYAVGTPASATLDLTSDDPITQMVTVAATRSTAKEAGLVPGKLTFTRTGTPAALAAPLTVRYTVGGTATAGSDYASLGTAITFPAGITTINRMVTPLQDALQEAPETIILTLTPGSLYHVGTPSSATVTLISDDVVTVTVAATRPFANEAGLAAGKLTFTRTGSTAYALTVTYAVTGTATAGVDYVSLGTSVTFPVGVSTIAKLVTPIQDGRQESDETVIVTLRSSPSYTLGSPRSATVTLTSDDTVTVTVAATRPKAGEGNLFAGKLTFTRTGSTAYPLTATYAVTGTATAGVDYVSLGTSVTFPVGASTITKLVTPLQDGLPEADESVVVTLTPNSTYTVGSPDSATVGITDLSVVILRDGK
jgi:hypothetical protein